MRTRQSRPIFAPIERIAHASGEVEKLINLFVNQFSDEEETPLQKNFGRTTLKFLVRADLYKSVVHRLIRGPLVASARTSFRPTLTATPARENSSTT